MDLIERAGESLHQLADALMARREPPTAEGWSLELIEGATISAKGRLFRLRAPSGLAGRLVEVAPVAPRGTRLAHIIHGAPGLGGNAGDGLFCEQLLFCRAPKGGAQNVHFFALPPASHHPTRLVVELRFEERSEIAPVVRSAPMDWRQPA